MLSKWQHFEHFWRQRWETGGERLLIPQRGTVSFLENICMGRPSHNTVAATSWQARVKVPWEQVSISQQPKRWAEQLHPWGTDQKNLGKLFWRREGRRQFLNQVSFWIAYRQKLMITHPKLLCFVALVQLLVSLSSKQKYYMVLQNTKLLVFYRNNRESIQCDREVDFVFFFWASTLDFIAEVCSQNSSFCRVFCGRGLFAVAVSTCQDQLSDNLVLCSRSGLMWHDGSEE